MKRILIAFACLVCIVVVAGLVLLLRYDPEIPDDVLRRRLEAKLVGHDVRDIDPVFAEERIERTNQMGMDGVMRDAGHEDIVMLKQIFVRVHTDEYSKVTSIETVDRWLGP